MFARKVEFKRCLPGYDYYKIHDIPHVAEVGVLMEYEAHSNNFGAHFHSKYPHEDGLQLLQLQGEDCFVVTGNSGVH